MSIPKYPIALVTEADLQALITGAVRENRTLEFKRETYGANDDARSEFLADISALANTLGGDLVIGLEENEGVASVLSGLDSTVNVDQEILRLTQIAQAGLQPRLLPLEPHPVKLENGRCALVIRVARSYQGPHRVVFKGRNRFWARSAGGKYEPDVEELRALFSAASQLAVRVRELRADRIVQVLSGDTPVPLQQSRGLAVMHIIPLVSATHAPLHVDLDRMQTQTSAWFPWGASGFNTKRNFDGFVTYSGSDIDPSRAYIQVFRSGMIEIVGDAVHDTGSGPFVLVDQLAKKFLTQAVISLPALQQARIAPPYSVHLTVSGVRGVKFKVQDATGFRIFVEQNLSVGRDVATFTDALLSDEDIGLDRIARALRPTLDHLFQTASLPTTPWFNSDGSLRHG